jgi:hypothetical protein
VRERPSRPGSTRAAAAFLAAKVDCEVGKQRNAG